ncbi:MAG TPA: hypothetical protein VLY45_06900 [Nitrospiria bacterium]|nr:hypothetical protein [Nitrospiria bacterium]
MAARSRKSAKKKPAKKTAKKKPVKKKPAKKKVAKRKPARRPAAKKRPAKTPAVKRPAPPPTPAVPPGEQPIGRVVHYYSHLGVAVISLDKGPLQVGDTIHIKGHTTDFRQRVESMQVEHESITKAVPGDDFGLKVIDHAREHDVVYRVLNP